MGMNLDIVSTSEIRKNLVPFLRSLGDGHQVTVLHRSKPLVTINSSTPKLSSSEPGSAEAIHRAIDKALVLSESRAGKAVLDPNKSIKELYAESVGEKYGVR